MSHLLRPLLFALVCLLASCAVPDATGGAIPAPSAGMGQIVLYRDIGYYEPSVVLTLALNDRSVGTLPRGNVIYRDVTPGTYTISFAPTRAAPDQFKTVTLRSGEVFYVKIEALPEIPCSGTRGGGVGGGCDISGFTSTVLEPARAQQEIRALSLISG